MDESQLTPIPQPPEKPFLGNVLDLSADTQVQDLIGLARTHGEIFYLQLGGRRLIVASSQRLVAELSDESRFDKRVWAPLRNVSQFAGDGLFTARTDEPNWRKAHNILLPNFGMEAMKRYHPSMLDIARQMFEKWDRLNPRDTIDVGDAMTRLTLDTIGLCGFDYRFNSFYRERMHPFVRAMTRALSIAMERSSRAPIPQGLLFVENKRFRSAVELMNSTVDGIIRERRESGEELGSRGDLLSAMLVGRDRESGEGLDDVNIRYQIITFLIAGHETTSGLLTFATHFVLKHPAVLRRLVAEGDRVLGPDRDAEPSYRQVSELRYTRQVLHEALRLWPTAPMYALYPKEGSTTFLGKYAIDQRDVVAVLLPMLHRDPEVWGRNAEAFDPEHFSAEAEAARPPHSYKPFGNGQRACIGRQFALHEATIALAMMLHRFRISDPGQYNLDIAETLTLKPKGLEIQVEPRSPVRSRDGNVDGGEDEPEATDAVKSSPSAVPTHGEPLLVLYGSNMGTSEALARRLAAQGERRGFVVDLRAADDGIDELRPEGIVLVVTSSYNGTPPDNATAFCSWLEESAPGSLEGVRYAVFGCGHRDWATTYQAVPTRVDERLAELGASRLMERGAADGGGDFDGDFERWDDALWAAASDALGIETPAEPQAVTGHLRLQVAVVDETHPSPFVRGLGAKPLAVVENRELQAPDSPRSTRHIELALPIGTQYSCGDHLGVIAQNDDRLVRRVLDRFGFDSQTRVRIDRVGPSAIETELPIGEPISAARLLTEYVELQDVATRSQIATLAAHTECPPDRAALEELCGDDAASLERYRTHILDPNRSLLDLLDDHAACTVPFGVFLGLLTPLRPRYYSISSSARVAERIVSVTVAVVRGPARSGHGEFRGVCSNYLAKKERGSTVYAFVRDTKSDFRLPSDPRTPLVLIGPGTGFAPFRGFLQERLSQAAAGEEIGRTLVFCGCRRRGEDDIYREEIETFSEDPRIEIDFAFSREVPERKVYVQHRLLARADDVWSLMEDGGRIYVCGDARAMAPAVRATFAEIYNEKESAAAAEAEEWLAGLTRDGRYLVDVWSS